MIRLAGAIVFLLSAGIGGWIVRSTERAEFDALVCSVVPGEVSLLYFYREGEDVPIEQGDGWRLERRLLMASGSPRRMDRFLDACTLRVPEHVSAAAPKSGRLTIRQTSLPRPLDRLGIRHILFRYQGADGSAEVSLRPAWRFWGACALLAAAPLALWGLAALLAAALIPRKRPEAR